MTNRTVGSALQFSGLAMIAFGLIGAFADMGLGWWPFIIGIALEVAATVFHWAAEGDEDQQSSS